MSLIGSTSRVVAGRKAVQTVYWRTAAQKEGYGESRIIKTKKTMSYGNSAPDPAILSTRNSPIKFDTPF